jgi:hypothetical protein
MARLLRRYSVVIVTFERLLALAVFVGVLAYLVGSFQVLLARAPIWTWGAS